MGILLAPLALILFIIVFIIETIFSLFFQTKNRKWFKIVSVRLHRKAKLIDIFGNYLFPEFWNFIFSKNGVNYKYGRWAETISSVTGKKRLEKSLSFTGLVLYYILYLIDFTSWKHGGHCIRWIQSEEEIKNFK